MTRVNLLLLALLMGSSIYLVKVSYEARRLYGLVDRAQAEERQLNIEHGRLQAERQTQAAPSLVEKTARGKLGMRSATPAVTHYVGYASAAVGASASATAGAAVASAAGVAR